MKQTLLVSIKRVHHPSNLVITCSSNHSSLQHYSCKFACWEYVCSFSKHFMHHPSSPYLFIHLHQFSSRVVHLLKFLLFTFYFFLIFSFMILFLMWENCKSICNTSYGDCYLEYFLSTRDHLVLHPNFEGDRFVELKDYQDVWCANPFEKYLKRRILYNKIVAN